MNKTQGITGNNITNKEDKTQHKISTACLAKCCDWRLYTTIFVNKDSFSLIFQAKQYNFRSLESSILNNCQLIDNISEITKNTIKSLEEKNDSLTEKVYNDIQFPIDNSENNYQILESNLGLIENLQNIVFLEFELDNTTLNKDHLKYFREVNNNFVDKEINFVLNGTVHGKKILKKDLKFSIETRKFIKSIQFRLENYKNDFIDKQNKFLRGNPNIEVKNSKFNFFTKILSNQNIGIEFKKPNFETVENYPTNFNTIVNSNIIINKIYLELSIPTQITNTSSSSNNNPIDNKTNISKAKFDYNNNAYLTNLTSFSKISPFKADQGNRPYFYVKNPIEKQQYSSNGKQGNGVKTSEISIYEMINQKDTNIKNKNGNGNGFYSKKDFDNNINGYLYKPSGFERKKVLSEHIQKDYISVNKNTNRPNYLNLFTNFYENMSNIHVLLKNITPFIEMTSENLENITIHDYFFKAFEKLSVFGLETNILYENEVLNMNYSPTISSFELHINNINLCNVINCEIMKRKNELKFIDSKIEGNLKLYEYFIQETSFKLMGYENKITIEFYEQKPHHYRNNFIDQIEIFFNNLPMIKDAKVFKDFEKSSWFSILWFPLRSLKNNLTNTSFLTYYSLNNFLETKSVNNFHEFPIIGVLPLRLDEQIWLSKINKNELKLFDLEYKLCLDKSIANVHEFLFSNTSQTSADYDYYFKNSF